MGCTSCQKPLDFQFEFAYQPIMDTRTEQVFFHEALVRGPKGESAASVLEKVDSHNIHSFDQKARYKAIETMANLDREGYVSINFLPRAVYDPNVCIKTTLDACDAFDFPKDHIIFEVSEQEKPDQYEHIIEIFEAYKAMGFRTAIDDFGSGHSGLNLLARFRPDMIKLDMALIRDIHLHHSQRIILKHIVSMCEELEIEVIGEGVESKEELDILIDTGIHYIQGYYYSRPLFKQLHRPKH